MNLLNEKVVDNAKKKDYNGKKKTYYFILLLKGRDDMTNIKKILATTLSILVVTSGSMATNAMVAVPNVPHQPFMPPIVGVPTVNSGQLSFKSIKTQIANFFSLSSKTDGQLKNTENLYSDESEEIGGQWEDRNKKVYDDIQWKFNSKNGELTVTGTGEIPFMNCFTEDCLPNLWESKKIVDQIKTLVIGEGITKVGDCAFCYLVSLRKVRLPKSVNHIDNHAFYGCTSLTEINLEDSNLTKMGYAALGSCNLSKIKLPSSLKEVEEKVFTGNSNLKEVKFCGTASPAYEKAAFDGCVNLTDVKVPEGYKGSQFCEKPVDCALNENCKIGGSCGENMLWELNDGTLNITGTGEMNSYGISGGPWKDYKDEITNVIIGGGVESIGSYAFEGCVNLQNVNISESVGQIGRGAFNNCTSLANVNFNGLSDLGCSNAFKDCGKLKSVNVPECFENNAFCGKNVSKILDHGSFTEPESSSSMESSQSSSESSGSMESSQSSSKLSSSSISEVNLGSKRIELIFSKEDIQISSVEESIKDIIDLDPGQYKITVKVIDDEEVKVTVQFVNEDDLNEFHKKVSECTK